MKTGRNVKTVMLLVVLVRLAILIVDLDEIHPTIYKPLRELQPEILAST